MTDTNGLFGPRSVPFNPAAGRCADALEVLMRMWDTKIQEFRSQQSAAKQNGAGSTNTTDAPEYDPNPVLRAELQPGGESSRAYSNSRNDNSSRETETRQETYDSAFPTSDTRSVPPVHDYNHQQRGLSVHLSSPTQQNSNP